MLKRTLNYHDLLFVAIGNIIGGGVFSLMGQGIFYGKGYTWLLLLLCGLAMLYMSQAYLDIQHKIKGNESEFKLAMEVGGNKFATIHTISSILSSTLTSSVITLAFAMHINKIFSLNLNTKVVATIVIAIVGIINSIGIRESVTVVNIMTGIELLTLIVLAMTIPKYINMKNLSVMPTFKQSLLVPLIMIFAFTGAEALPKLAGESKNNLDIPKAITSSISITTILYACVSIVMISVLNTNSITNTPMIDAYEKIFNNGKMIGIVALFSIFNTVLMSNISASRTLYGYGVQIKDENLVKVNKRQTPYIAIGICTILAIIFIQFGSMEKLAILSNISIMFTMIMINMNAYKDKKRIRNIISIILAVLFTIYGMISHNAL